VNARHLKNGPGRKSDVSDCEWLRELHSVGLLRGSFRPTDAIVALRAYLRHRQTLVESAATYVLRMQKALVQMNLQLPVVISDITGVTGLRILRDVVAAHRDPAQLAAHRDARCRASHAEIVAALTGNYRAEHLFVLQQNLELFDACQIQLAEVRNAYRLFMVPGMAHCWGGDGATAFDPLGALEKCVEMGTAPDRIVAFRCVDGKIDRTHPLCPYPQAAEYRGTRSTDVAENFICRPR